MYQTQKTTKMAAITHTSFLWMVLCLSGGICREFLCALVPSTGNRHQIYRNQTKSLHWSAKQLGWLAGLTTCSVEERLIKKRHECVNVLHFLALSHLPSFQSFLLALSANLIPVRISVHCTIQCLQPEVQFKTDNSKEMLPQFFHTRTHLIFKKKKRFILQNKVLNHCCSNILTEWYDDKH